MDAAGQHGVVVRHQRDVVGVVAADVIERIAEVLAAREVLLETGEAAAQRMTARVDDLGIRQHQVDEPDVRPVVRQLVDEVGRVGLALDAGLLQVTLAEFAQGVGFQRLEHLGVLRDFRAPVAAAQFLDDADDVRQFHRAFDRRMARQDLLDQRRPRTRQPHDEDRVGRRAPHAAARRKELGREQRT